MQVFKFPCKACNTVFYNMPALCVVIQVVKIGLHVLHEIQNFFSFLLEVQSYIHTNLQRFAMLFISTSHGFEIESGVIIVGEISSPKVNLYSLGL